MVFKDNDDAAIDILVDNAGIELDTNAYARGKDTVNWELN